jgi:hypothetical protein
MKSLCIAISLRHPKLSKRKASDIQKPLVFRGLFYCPQIPIFVNPDSAKLRRGEAS